MLSSLIRSFHQPSAMPPATSPLPAHQMMWSNPYMFSPYYSAQLAQWYHASLLQQQGGAAATGLVPGVIRL